MPLSWVSSGLMVFLLVLVFINLYFMGMYQKFKFDKGVLKNFYNMEW